MISLALSDSESEELPIPVPEAEERGARKSTSPLLSLALSDCEDQRPADTAGPASESKEADAIGSALSPPLSLRQTKRKTKNVDRSDRLSKEATDSPPRTDYAYVCVDVRERGNERASWGPLAASSDVAASLPRLLTDVPSASRLSVDLSKRGFVPRKRSVASAAALRRSHNPFDFVFENPLDGKLKDLPFVRRLITGYPFDVRFLRTSYCHYALCSSLPLQRKRTCFLTSLLSMSLKRPCPTYPCQDLFVNGRHAVNIAELAKKDRNSIPELIIDEEMRAWKVRTPWAKHRIFLDIFSGWGSVVRRVRQQHTDVHAFANDIVRRDDNDAEIDVHKFGIEILIALSVQKCLEIDLQEVGKNMPRIRDWMREEEIAMLIHMSTPCETYSTAAGATHRGTQSVEAKTDKAASHDAMNEKLVEWMVEHVLDGKEPLT